MGQSRIFNDMETSLAVLLRESRQLSYKVSYKKGIKEEAEGKEGEREIEKHLKRL